MKNKLMIILMFIILISTVSASFASAEADDMMVDNNITDISVDISASDVIEVDNNQKADDDVLSDCA